MFVEHEGRLIWKLLWSMLTQPAQLVRPRLTNDILGDYWRVHDDYNNQWLEAVVHVLLTMIDRYAILSHS